MPKLVDNYVLTRKIGGGQFGEVLKGYDRTTNNDVAVKVIKRQNLKGKYVELLENQVKVLKGCVNQNIVKLYDFKKTSNNYYLVLEYCNEGDLQDYVRKKKHLAQDEAVEFLVQILHGFRTLVKNKILHRDFKLPNILLHDGQIKIADFGFAKLLAEEEFAKTVLGSPLNMAPEIIIGKEYNNKADIYSIGVCFYEMLFGKPPFNAANIVELEKLIRAGEVPFPKHINKISPGAEDLICRMLAYDPQKRIDWQELFSHPILHSLEDGMQGDLTVTLGKEGNLLSNMSKFYIKQNMVILHPNDIIKKEEINNFAFEVVKNKDRKEFKGELIIRDTCKENSKPIKGKRPEEKDIGDSRLERKESEGEILTKAFKSNSRFLLTERNKLVFILSIVKELEERLSKKNAKMILWVTGQLLNSKVKQLCEVLVNGQNLFKLPNWEEYLESSQYETLSRYFGKEADIITYEFEQLSRLAQNSPSNLVSLLKGYLAEMIQQIQSNRPFEEINRLNWIHLDHLLDLAHVDEIMKSQEGEEFNFKLYYLENGKISMEELVGKVTKKSKI